MPFVCLVFSLYRGFKRSSGEWWMSYCDYSEIIAADKRSIR